MEISEKLSWMNVARIVDKSWMKFKGNLKLILNKISEIVEKNFELILSISKFLFNFKVVKILSKEIVLKIRKNAN